MKELSIEQKAKAYDEAIKIAQETYNAQPVYRNWLESMFPELQKSEDERIRKSLCKAIWTYIPTEEGQEYIAWLEKQRPVELQWRPTEGQMDSIKQAVANMKNSGSYDSELVSLYNELKALYYELRTEI